MELPDSRCEASAADGAADGTGGDLGLKVGIVEDAVEIPAGETTEVSRSEEADDGDSDTPRNTPPSEEGSVGWGMSTTPGEIS
jgi:hypothetical protein